MARNFTKPFQWILDNRYRWVFHVLFWIVMYLDEFLSLFGITDAFPSLLEPAIGLAADMLMVYINIYILIPLFLLKNRITLYSFFTLLTIVSNNAVNHFIFFDTECIECSTVSYLIIALFIPTLTLLGTAVGINIFKRFLINTKRINDLQTSNLESELNFLKHQINPHFLFNALNNIYVLTRKRPKEAPESILLLSDLLRYQLYDCGNEMVPLNNEIEYLNNYLKLNKIRIGMTDLTLEITGQSGGRIVAPFIFLPFIENAFKHGINEENSGSTGSYIQVKFDITAEKINFHISNTTQNKQLHAVGGIGLSNVKRRLNLIYPNKHVLNIEEKSNVFSVDLSISDK